MASTPFQSPSRCGLCQHTIRDGEAYEDRTWETSSGSPMPGVVHTLPCPELQPVPCAPCLWQLLAGEVTEPHTCQLVTTVGIDSGRLVIGPEQDCLCPCQSRAAEESDALRTARAAARGLAAPAPLPAVMPPEE